MSVVQVAGQTVPAELLGELRDGSRWREDPAGLRNLMAEEGYLFVRQAIPAAVADRARHEILSRLAAVDEVDDPLGAGTFTGRSRRRELQPDLGAFWTSVSEGEAIRRATHGPELRGLLSALLAEPAQPHDYLFVRVGTPGKATGLHYDMPFFCRGSNRVHTVWPWWCWRGPTTSMTCWSRSGGLTTTRSGRQG